MHTALHVWPYSVVYTIQHNNVVKAYCHVADAMFIIQHSLYGIVAHVFNKLHIWEHHEVVEDVVSSHISALQG